MIKWTITRHSKSKCIEEIKNLDEDAQWLVEIKKHNRSEMQNRTVFMWYREIAKAKGDETPTDVRAYCKLHYGVPILREDNDDFREDYDQIVRPLSYENKLKIMVEPLDLPVTRIMTVDQMQRYMEEVEKYGYSFGVELTIPNEGEML
jgi:hypothetical protein